MVHNLCCISCTEPVSEEELLDICGENTLRKYRYFRSKYAHRNNPFAAWCPREGCWCLLSDVIKHLPFSVQEFSCPDCNLKICRRCISESHEDGICPIPTATITHNALVRLWQTLHTKKCPVCSVRIERAGGCSQMRCASCQTKFCWRCRGVLVTVRNPHQRVTHRCICPRLNSTITWISLAGGIVVGVPVALAAAVVAGPPALVVYLALPSRKKRDIRGEMFSFFQRL